MCIVFEGGDMSRAGGLHVSLISRHDIASTDRQKWQTMETLSGLFYSIIFMPLPHTSYLISVYARAVLPSFHWRYMRLVSNTEPSREFCWTSDLAIFWHDRNHSTAVEFPYSLAILLELLTAQRQWPNLRGDTTTVSKA